MLNKCKYEKRFFWNLKEVLNPLGNKEGYNLSNAEVLSIIASMTGYSTPLINNGSWTKQEYGKVLDLVIKRYLDHYCFYTLSEEFSVEKQKNFIAKMLYIVEMTSPRYLKLLSIYTSEDNKLLNPVEISSEALTRFNDTPQDEGDFANDEHTTNLTEDTRSTKNDLDTPMGRIREIESNYNNLLLNWSNEFESLFLEESNI